MVWWEEGERGTHTLCCELLAFIRPTKEQAKRSSRVEIESKSLEATSSSTQPVKHPYRAAHSICGRAYTCLPRTLLPPPGTSAAATHGRRGGVDAPLQSPPWSACPPPFVVAARTAPSQPACQPAIVLKGAAAAAAATLKCLNLNLGWMRGGGARVRAAAPYFPRAMTTHSLTLAVCLRALQPPRPPPCQPLPVLLLARQCAVLEDLLG